MKSIRQKAKAYDEAIERAKKVHKYSSDLAEIKRMEEIFPELAEFEDERIRKELIRAFNSLNTIKIWNGIELTDILAWLKKQGQKSVTIDIDKMVIDYANTKERGNEEFGKPVNCMIRAYRQGLTDALSALNLERKLKENNL